MDRRNLKVLIDPQIFWVQKYGGISNSITSLLQQARADNHNSVICPIAYHDNDYLKASEMYPINQVLAWIGNKGFRGSQRLIRAINLYLVKRAIRRFKPDVILGTYYDPYLLSYMGSIPFVLMVYDFIYERYPDYFLDKKLINNKRILIERANHVIAISKSTRNDLIRNYGDKLSKKSHVVHLNHSIQHQSINGHLPDNYILFVGKRSGYKNFELVLNVMPGLTKKVPNLKLLCLGGGSLTDSEEERISQLKLKSRIVFRPYNELELSTVYSNARAFVFPSKYEGFGIPVLEAMSSGCPAILAKNSSLVEVGGDVALFFDDNNPDDLERKIFSVLENEELRHKLIADGLEWSKRFSWEYTYNKLMDVCAKAAMNE